jgi:hypothetical protein
MLLIITTTQQVLQLNYSEGRHYRTHQLVFYRMFLHEDDYTDINMERWQNVFSLDDLQQQVSDDVSNYYSLKNASGDLLDRYQPRMQTDAKCFMNKT